MIDDRSREEFQRLIGSVVKEMFGKLDASLFTTTTTASTAEAKPFTLKDLYKARFAMEGLEIQENPLMPDHCIAFVPKDKKDVVWFNIETGRMYHFDAEKHMREMWPDMYEHKPKRSEP